MEWLEPWWPIAEMGREFAATFETVLHREVADGHCLFGIPVEAIGRHSGSDDTLFRLLDGTGRVAVVHLTWTRNPPEQPPWPITEIYTGMEAWSDERMKPEHDESND